MSRTLQLDVCYNNQLVAPSGERLRGIEAGIV